MELLRVRGGLLRGLIAIGIEDVLSQSEATLALSEVTADRFDSKWT
jgi:hypothetical protein